MVLAPANHLYSFLIGVVLAMLLAGPTAAWFARREGLRLGQNVVVLMAIVASIAIGSKLLYIVEHWPGVLQQAGGLRAELLSRRLRIPGGILLMIGIGPFLALALRFPYLRVTDAMVPAAGLVIFGLRIGCHLEGCCFGTPTDLPWAVTFPPLTDAHLWHIMTYGLDPSAPASLPVHPLQLYFAAVGLLLFFGLVLYRRHQRYEGEILVAFLFFYMWSTWLLEFLRDRPHPFTQTLVLVCAALVSITWLVVELRRRAGTHLASVVRPARSMTPRRG